MIRSFADTLTERLFNGEEPGSVAKELLPRIRRKLDAINAAAQLQDLAAPKGNRLEKLSGELSGFYSVRVNKQWRIIFKWSEAGADDVRFVDYHD